MKDFENLYFDNKINFSAIFYKILRKWFIFLVTISISIAIAYVYNLSKNNTFKGEVKILIKNNDGGSIDVQKLIGISDQETSYVVENEIELINSISLLTKVMEKTKWYVSLYKKKKLSFTDAYETSPFEITIDTNSLIPIGLRFYINVTDDNKVELSSEGGKAKYYNIHKKEFENDIEPMSIGPFKKIVDFGSEIKIGELRFKVDDYDPTNKEKRKNYFFYFNTFESQVRKYLNKFEVAVTSKKATVLSISLNDDNPEKVKDILNRLADEYIVQGLKKKNEVAFKTVDFIDEELVKISEKLDLAETNLENYKKTNKISYLDKESAIYFENYNALNKELAENEFRKNIYSKVKSTILKNDVLNNFLIPTSIDLEDGNLNVLIHDLIKLTDQRGKLTFNSKEINPNVKNLDVQIAKSKENILALIENKIQAINLKQKDLDSNYKVIERKIKELPTNQKMLLGYERNFNLYDQLYTYLLQKRAESQITSYTNISDNYVIDYCNIYNLKTIYFNKTKTYFLAILIASLISLTLIFLPNFIFDKFESEGEVSRISPFPMLGAIIHSSTNSSNVVQNEPNSIATESFRKIRTNLGYVSKGENNIVILISSYLPKTGKTFISNNLATAFANTGKKTIVISCDMRKQENSVIVPSQNANLGLSSYLSRIHEIEDVIIKSDIPNLYYIGTGPIPPNASELIDNQRTNMLFTYLKANFDIAIVDTPAMNLFTDTNIIMRFSDVNIVVTRIGHSVRSDTKKIFNEWLQNEVKNPAVLVNDLHKSSIPYSYYYNKYGYYGSNEPKGIFKIKFLRKLFKYFSGEKDF